MKFNNKGYSMVELFAVIFIASAIIFPMMTTLVNNFEINDRIQNRRSSTSIAQGTLEGFGRFNFGDVEALVIASNLSNTYYVEFDSTNCTQLTDTVDINLCNLLFASTNNNLTLTDTTFQVYLFNYNLTSTMKSSLLSNPNVPSKIKEEITLMTPTVTPNPSLYYIYVWIEYDDATSSVVMLGGLLAND